MTKVFLIGENHSESNAKLFGAMIASKHNIPLYIEGG